MMGMSVEDIFEFTAIDPWFLDKMQELLETEKFLKRTRLQDLTKETMFEVKQLGFSDRQIAYATKTSEDQVRAYRKQLGVVPIYKTVDTCAAEFEAFTPYYYSTYEVGAAIWDLGDEEKKVSPVGHSLAPESEVLPSSKRKVMILGGGRTGSDRELSLITAAVTLPIP